jgi:hypothetical protein
MQSTASTLELTGSGFVQGAKAFLGGTEVGTTFAASDSLTVMLGADDIATPGDYTLTVRNNPDDRETASEGIAITVTPLQTSGCEHSECAAGARLPLDCSACATAVCVNEFKYCCGETWDTACAEHADSLQVCQCDITGAGGNDGGGGTPGAAGEVGTRGGSAGTAQGGTAGFAGAATACTLTCSDAKPLGSESQGNFCNQSSETINTNLQDCACSTCQVSCAATACNALTADQTCVTCLASSCTDFYGPCVADGVAQ